MKKRIIKIVTIIASIYILLCGLLYLFQENLIFFPQKLDKNFQFQFDNNFEEINIKTKDGKVLNSLLFKADSSKGVFFYLHGNAGNLSFWGNVAQTYLDLNYDVFMLDYRGYGKSESDISSQQQLFDDIQIAYDEIKKLYGEDKIVVLGYSIGSGLAAKIAATNHPRLLILQAPYYNLTDLMNQRVAFISTFILKYKLKSNEYLKSCKMPVVIFHGNEDKVIYYGSSLKLKEAFKSGDTLITLDGMGHNGMTENKDYKTGLVKILKK